MPEPIMETFPRPTSTPRESNVLKLYEVVNALVEVGEALIDNGGELTPELEQELGGLDLAFEDKIEKTLLYAKNLEASGAAAAIEADRLRQLSQGRINASKRLEEYVKREMERASRPKVETDRIRASIVKNSRPRIEWVKSVEECPERFVRVRREVNGDAAYQEWKSAGGLPEGFAVQLGSHLRIR